MDNEALSIILTDVVLKLFEARSDAPGAIMELLQLYIAGDMGIGPLR